jgi:hypothetical protein
MINFSKSRTIHQKNKIIYKTIVHPTVCYVCETWTMSGRLDACMRKILRWIYCPIEDDKVWRIRYNTEIYDL